MRGGSFQSTTLIAVAMLLLILFVSAGYMLLIPGPEDAAPSHETLTELKTNRELWERSKPASFRYVVDRSCFCGVDLAAPYVATEEKGYKYVGFRTAVESAGGEFLTQPPSPVWIDDVFDEIEEAFADVIASNIKPTIDVRYDERYGYPLSLSIRYPIPDTYITYEIQDFEVLEYREE